MRKRIWRMLAPAALALFALACLSPLPPSAYESLLALFSVERPGYGPDSHFDEELDQAMTYGLVAWAEAIRCRRTGASSRLRNSAKWLVDNADTDADGLPGWGLPAAYDTWSDGSVNPADTPYTITTALCAIGLARALACGADWTEEFRQRARGTIHDVAIRWSESCWSDGYGGGYFWYSPSRNDRIFCTNASAMMVSALLDALAVEPTLFAAEERRLVEARVRLGAASLREAATLRDQAPFWRYAPVPNALGHDTPNDSLHQAYILWGVESYRDRNASTAFPWSREESMASLDRFFDRGVNYLYPRDTSFNTKSAERLDRLWGMGMSIAVYARWGDPARAQRLLEVLERDYGEWPSLSEWPTETEHTPFFPRQAAHVLLGLAILEDRLGAPVEK